MYWNNLSVYSRLLKEWGNNAPDNHMEYVEQYTKEQIFEALDKVKEEIWRKTGKSSKFFNMGLFLIDILSVQINNWEWKEKESLTILEQYYRYLWKAKKLYEEFLELNTKLKDLESKKQELESEWNKKSWGESAEKYAGFRNKRSDLNKNMIEIKKQHKVSWSAYIHAYEELEKYHNNLKEKFGMVDE